MASPLAGEGVVQRTTDEGKPHYKFAVSPLTRPPFGGHPLPQGEREETCFIKILTCNLRLHNALNCYQAVSR